MRKKVYNVRYKGWILGFGHGPVKCKLDSKLVANFQQYQDPDERRIAALKIFSIAFDVEPDGIPTFFSPSRLEIRPVAPSNHRAGMFQKLQKSKTVIGAST